MLNSPLLRGLQQCVRIAYGLSILPGYHYAVCPKTHQGWTTRFGRSKNGVCSYGLGRLRHMLHAAIGGRRAADPLSRGCCHKELGYGRANLGSATFPCMVPAPSVSLVKNLVFLYWGGSIAKGGGGMEVVMFAPVSLCSATSATSSHLLALMLPAGLGGSHTYTHLPDLMLKHF